MILSLIQLETIWGASIFLVLIIIILMSHLTTLNQALQFRDWFYLIWCFVPSWFPQNISGSFLCKVSYRNISCYCWNFPYTKMQVRKGVSVWNKYCGSKRKKLLCFEIQCVVLFLQSNNHCVIFEALQKYFVFGQNWYQPYALPLV